MQVLDNGDLAILFEDGSIGNMDNQDNYAISYAVISKELMEQKIEELNTLNLPTTTGVKVADGTKTNGPTTYGALSDADSNGSNDTWTSNDASSKAGVTVVADANISLIEQADAWSTKTFKITPKDLNTAGTLTITAPEGYLVYGLKAEGGNWSSTNTTTVISCPETGASVTATGDTGATQFSLSTLNIKSQTAHLTFTSTGSSKTAVALTTFTIYLVEDIADEEPTISQSTGSFSGTGSYHNTWTSTSDNPTVTFTSNYNNMQWDTNNRLRMFGQVNSNDNKSYTISLPAGYAITDFHFTFASECNEPITVACGDVSLTVEANASGTFSVTNVNRRTATFVITSPTASNSTAFINTPGIYVTLVPVTAEMVSVQNAEGTVRTQFITPYNTTPTVPASQSYSPLVTYAEAVHDADAYTWTITYTPVNPTSYPAATGDTEDYTGWFYARVRGDRFMQYNPLADTRDDYSHYDTDQFLYFGPEMQWALIGDPYESVQIVNRKAGEGRFLSRNDRSNTDDNVHLHLVSGSADAFTVSPTATGFLLKLVGEDAWLNDVGGGGYNAEDQSRLYGGPGLKRENGSTDQGSTWLFTAADDNDAVNALSDFVRYTDDDNVDHIANYVASACYDEIQAYFPAAFHHYGAVNDFPDEATRNKFETEFKKLAGTAYTGNETGSFPNAWDNYYSQVSTTTYRDFARRLRASLATIQDGHNYVLVNMKTDKALGYNDGTFTRGYTSSSTTYTFNQTDVEALSVVWTAGVGEDGVTHPTLSAGSLYLPNDDLKMVDAPTQLFVDFFPCKIGIGQMGRGTLRSVGDDVGLTPDALSESANRFAYGKDDARRYMIPASSFVMNIKANGLGGRSFATYYAPFDATIVTEGTTAYILASASDISEEKNECYLTQYRTVGQVIPKGVPVVLINTNEETAIAMRPLAANTGEAAPEANLLGGVYNTVMQEASWYNDHYTFGKSNVTGLPGFYKYVGSDYSFPANRCYSEVPAGSSIRGFALVVDDTVTGVTVGDLFDDQPTEVFDLQGRRVARPVKGGVYIVNGKKVYVK